MKTTHLIISSILLLTLFGCQEEENSSKNIETTDQQKETSDASKTIAIVNGVVIPESRLKVYSIADPSHREDRDTTIENIITSELIANYARDKGFHLREEVAQELIVAQQAILGRAFTQEFLENHVVDDATIDAEYKILLEKYAEKIEYQTAHILVEDEALANELLEKITADPEKFAELAKEHSTDPGSSVTGGDLGWLATDRLVPEFAEAMVALAKGGLSDKPVKSDYGWHIIRVDATQTVKPPELNEEMRIQLEQTAQAKEFIAFIQQLNENATIELIEQE